MSLSIWMCALCAVFIGPSAQAQSAAEIDFTVEEIADGVYVHFGQHEDMTGTNAGDIANVGFIVGEESVAVVDPGGSPLLGEHLAAAIKEHTSLPVRHVVITHVHPDHMLGISAFVGEDVRVYGHRKLAAAIAQRGEFYLQRLIAALGSAMQGATLVAPTDPVSEITEIDLGNRVLVLRAHNTAHTDHDLSVFDNRTRTLWAGDLVFDTRIPSLDGSLTGWLDEMDVLSALGANLVVPGHGRVSTLVDIMPKQRNYLDQLLTETRAAVARNQRLPEAIESIGMSASRDWALYDLHHKGNVTKAYTELEWE